MGGNGMQKGKELQCVGDKEPRVVKIGTTSQSNAEGLNTKNCVEDPFKGDLPEVIEDSLKLQNRCMRCIAFNRWGTLLAAGCADGSAIIWDFETRGVAKELQGTDCIMSICWSKNGRYLLVSAIDKSLILWNVQTGEKMKQHTLKQTAHHVCLQPGSGAPSLCLACPLSSAPILVSLNTGSNNLLPDCVSETGISTTIPRQLDTFSDCALALTPAATTFNKYGDLIYVGNLRGEILIIDTQNAMISGVIPIPGGSVVKDIIFSRNGQYLLTNSDDCIIRVYENLLPTKGAAKELKDISKNTTLHGKEKLKEIGADCLRLCRELQDAVRRIQWRAPCFSGDGQWVIGASATKVEHKLCIWDRMGHLVKVLEGPKKAVSDLAWHPLRPLVVSLAFGGCMHIWAKDYTDSWSSFFPDFTVIEENIEYIEREDEFDIDTAVYKVEDLDIDEDEEVDILTVEKSADFSDSEASEEELRYLPPMVLPDVPEHQNNSSRLEVGGHSGSFSSSIEVVRNDQDNLSVSSSSDAMSSTFSPGYGASNRRFRTRCHCRLKSRLRSRRFH